MVLTELSRVLEMEATVLARLGLDTALIGKILADIERTLAGTRASTPLDAIAWQQGLSRASEQVCSFPQVEILAMDNDFGRFVRRVTKTRTLIRVMFTGAANIVAASQFPEPATIKSLSTFLAFVAASMLNEQG
ncbi:MAG: hypothetical protein KDG53_12905, partial [Rhodocyclaceae bacterium]|nr:hypothetical protein [Rhodocyclaceae bacterium]